MGVNGPDDVKVTNTKRLKYKLKNKQEAEDYHAGLKTYINQRFQNWMV